MPWVVGSKLLEKTKRALNMGWASGSRLMNKLISSFDLAIGQNEIPEDSVVAFWKAVISEFEDDDWDTQCESLGLSKLWDRAYFEEHPYDNGYFHKPGAINPYQDGSEFAEEWRQGYNDILGEQELAGGRPSGET